MLCQECSKRSTCEELCLKAQKYVGQDHVAQRELPVSPIRDNDDTRFNTELDLIFHHSGIGSLASLIHDSYPHEGISFLTPLQNTILRMFYNEGLTYRQIARALSGNPSKREINHYAVKGQIQRAKQKIRSFSSKNKGRE